MFKNLFYAVLFIALVVGLSFVMSTYLPIQQVANISSHADELTQLRTQVAELAGLNKHVEELADLKAQVAELTLIAEQVSTLALQLEDLAQTRPSETDTIQVIHAEQSHLLGKALLQTLNCKYVAQNHSSTRLIAELSLLEETIKELDMDQETLAREVTLARTETAANIPSAQDRLEIIWKLLLMADREP